jgi:hypothetical protein
MQIPIPVGEKDYKKEWSIIRCKVHKSIFPKGFVHLSFDIFHSLPSHLHQFS